MTPDQSIAKFTDLHLSLDTRQLTPDLYFESATGLGKWRMFSSSRCLRALTRDREQSRLAFKKLEYVHVVCSRIK
jgi:hypothetical protein